MLYLETATFSWCDLEVFFLCPPSVWFPTHQPSGFTLWLTLPVACEVHHPVLRLPGRFGYTWHFGPSPFQHLPLSCFPDSTLSLNLSALFLSPPGYFLFHLSFKCWCDPDVYPHLAGRPTRLHPRRFPPLITSVLMTPKEWSSVVLSSELWTCL